MDPDLPTDSESLWLRHRRPVCEPLTGDARADVVVVGGGIAGITTALLLARAGASVLVLEARSLGAGTTGHTTGKVTALQGTRYRSISRHHGADAARIYAEAQDFALRWLDDEVRVHGVDASWQRRPAYTYAGTAEGRRTVEEEAEAAAAAGLPVEVVDDAGLPYEHHGAVLLADQAQLDPVPYLHAAAEEIAATVGCAVHTGTRVLSVEGRRRPTVVTEHGRVRAGHVVVSTLMPITDRGMFFARAEPTGSYAIAVDVDGPLPTGMYLSADQPSRSLRTAPGADGEELLVVGGGGHTVGRRSPTSAVQDELLGWTRERFTVRSVPARWFAHDVVPVDVLPWAGPATPWSDVLVTSGFGKWGMTNGVAAAHVVADHVLGHRDGPSAPWRDVYDPYHASLRGALGAGRLNAEVAVELAQGWVRPGRRPTGPDGDGASRRAGLVPVGRARTEPAPGDDHPKDDGAKDDRAKDDRAVGDRAARSRAGAAATGPAATAEPTEVSIVCTHLGGVCRWNDAERTWDCPLHGSRFAADGTVVAGPATRPLGRSAAGRGRAQATPGDDRDRTGEGPEASLP